MLESIDLKSSSVQRGVFDTSKFNWDDVNIIFNNYSFQPKIELITPLQEKINPPKKRTKWNGDVYDIQWIKHHLDRDHSFITYPLNRYNIYINSLCNSLEELVNGCCDVHAYGGLTQGSKSFPRHTDLPHNLILQCDGVSLWKVWDSGRLVVDTELRPGDAIFIPAQWMHQCIPVGKRLSLSFPFTESHRVNREWYDFTKAC